MARKSRNLKALTFRTKAGKVAVEPNAGKTYKMVLSEAYRRQKEGGRHTQTHAYEYKGGIAMSCKLKLV